MSLPRRAALKTQCVVSCPSSRDKGTEPQERQYSIHRDIPILLPRTRCHRQGSLRCPVNLLYTSRVPPGSFPALWQSPPSNGRGMMNLSIFAASQSSLNRSISLSPKHTLSRILFLILGNPHKKGSFTLCKMRKLFDDYSSHISTKIFWKVEGWYYLDFWLGGPPLFSGLHCASVFGIDEIFAGLVHLGRPGRPQTRRTYNGDSTAFCL